MLFKNRLGIGDWGLGIGPNPQSPIPFSNYNIHFLYELSLLYNKKYNLNI